MWTKWPSCSSIKLTNKTKIAKRDFNSFITTLFRRIQIYHCKIFNKLCKLKILSFCGKTSRTLILVKIQLWMSK